MRNSRKRGRSFGPGVVEIWKREVGDLVPRVFAHRVWASENLVLRLGIHRKLHKHRGCVNTISFNSDGNILVSGSDDRMIMLWDWDMGAVKLAFHSDHQNNVFQATIMPCTDDRRILTCAADGEVRYAQILEGGQVDTKMLTKHEGRVHRMAIEPGSPHIFYSCGQDGLVQHFDLRTESATPLFKCKSFQRRSTTLIDIVSLHAIAIDPRNPNLFAVAGSDEYARIYDIRKFKWDGSTDFNDPSDCFCPPHLIDNDKVEITGLAFSDQGELLVSYCNESIYLFPTEGGLGPDPVRPSSIFNEVVDNDSKEDPASADPSSAHSDPKPQAYKGHLNCDTMKGVNFSGPNCEYVVSGSDCGRIFIWRKKDGNLLRVMEGDKHVVNCIESHPHAPIIASSGIENDIKIWIPNATEPAPPVNKDELKHRRRSNFHRLTITEDVIRHLLLLQLQLSNAGQSDAR